MGGDDVFHDAAATAGALDPDAVVGAVAVAVEEADVADAAGFFTADGAHAVAMGDVAAEVGDILGGAIHLPASSSRPDLIPKASSPTSAKQSCTRTWGRSRYSRHRCWRIGGLMIRQLPTSMFSLYSRWMAQKGELRKLGPSMRTSLQSLI